MKYDTKSSGDGSSYDRMVMAIEQMDENQNQNTRSQTIRASVHVCINVISASKIVQPNDFVVSGFEANWSNCMDQQQHSSNLNETIAKPCSGLKITSHFQIRI